MTLGGGSAPLSRVLRGAPAWNLAVMLLLVTALAYFRTWAELWPLWLDKNDTYTHGVLIAAIALWLTWRTRSRLAETPVLPNPRVLPALLLLSMASLFAAAANVMVVHTMLWPMLALALLWAGAGWHVARQFFLPLGFLYFAIPFWDFFEPALQSLASRIVNLVIRIVGTPVAVDGTHIMLPSVTLHIAQACSGAHFLAISLAMGTLAGELRGDRLRTRLLILAMAGGLSIAFNSIRILLLVLAYLHPRIYQSFESLDHLSVGWWIFAVDILVLMLLLRLIPVSRNHVSARLNNAQPAAPPAATGPKLALTIATAVLLPAISWGAQRFDHYPPPSTAVAAITGTSGPMAPDPRWQPLYRGPAAEQRVAYLLPNGHMIDFYRNEYHRQRQGRELISSANQMFSEPAFRQQELTPARLDVPGTAPIEVNKVRLLDQTGRSWSAIYTYIVDGEPIASASRALRLSSMRALYRRPVAGVFATTTPCVPNCAAVEESLEFVTVRAYEAYEGARRK